MEILPGNGLSIVKSTWFGLTSWGPVTEARPLPVHGSTPGTCHCLQYQSSWSEVIFNLYPLWWWCDPIQQETTSLSQRGVQ